MVKQDKTFYPLEVRMSDFENHAIVIIADILKLTKEQAREVVLNDEKWLQLMRIKKRQFDLEAIELMNDIKDAVNDKRERGSLEQMKAAVTSLGILHDKIYGESTKLVPLHVAGKQINIHLDWKFKPYTPKSR